MEELEKEIKRYRNATDGSISTALLSKEHDSALIFRSIKFETNGRMMTEGTSLLKVLLDLIRPFHIEQIGSKKAGLAFID